MLRRLFQIRTAAIRKVRWPLVESRVWGTEQTVDETKRTQACANDHCVVYYGAERPSVKLSAAIVRPCRYFPVCSQMYTSQARFTMCVEWSQHSV